MNNTSVEAYIQARVLPQYHPIVAMVRELMKEVAPEAVELISYDMISYKGKKYILAYMSPNQQGITLGFVHGKEFEDRYGLLREMSPQERLRVYHSI